MGVTKSEGFLTEIANDGGCNCQLECSLMLGFFERSRMALASAASASTKPARDSTPSIKSAGNLNLERKNTY
jgi:hypothetical protein